MKTSQLIAGCMVAWLGSAVLLAADVRQGLVSYWPLDAISADLTTTADLVSGYDLNTVNWFDTSGVVPGKRGNAFQFDGTSQYAYLTMYGEETDRLPISKAASFTVMFWVKGAAKQSDRRVFSESNSLLGDNDPLVNIGTHNAGADGTIDLFFRNSTGGVQLNHQHSPGTAFDNTWHHVALVDVSGAVTLYLDGTNTMTARYTREANPIQDTLSIGAIVRGNGSNIGARFAGTIDEVAVWERALSMEEIQDVMNNGIQTPVPAFGPFITLDPVGSSKLRVGDSFTLTAGAAGVRPLTYQWLKGENEIADATSATLVLTDLQVADSGDYKLRVTNIEGSTVSAAATLVVNPLPEPNLTSQVVSLWRLDDVQGNKTYDIVSEYDMELVNLTAADVVPGKWGNCFQFDAARQTLLQRINNPAEGLPIYQHPDFSVSLWAKGDYSIQTDRRVFAEGSTKNANPLFNIGTHNGGTDGSVDIYIRTDTGGTVGDHHHSAGIAFDGDWHHILYTQRDLGGGVTTAHLYIDGVLDTMKPDPVRPLTLDTTTIGGILRNTSSAWFTGQIDDVIVWNRGLTAAEAQLLATAPMPDPPPNFQPLVISAFTSSMPEVVEGDSVRLRWDVRRTAEQILIDNGVGDVTSMSVSGAGSVSVTPTATTTYTLTIKRGEEQLSARTTVTVLKGVEANWAALDNFDEHSPGPISRTAWWSDTRGEYAQVENLNGNHMLSVRTTDSAVVLPIGSLKITEGQERTLFFRILVREPLPTAALRHVIGLTDKNIRSQGDTTSNIGPVLHANFDTAAPPWFLGVINYVGGAIEYATDPLETGALYSVWIDIKNEPMNDPVSPYDIFSVYIKKDGAEERTELWKDYLSDRDALTPDPVLGPMMPDLDKLFVTGNNTAASLWFDDFFISKSGYNATEPVPFNQGGTPEVSIAIQGANVVLTFTGILTAADQLTGPWTDVAETSPLTISASGAQKFYRARR
ncbi:MAG: hypothetical protein KA191_03365 [Verrucomicrobia bacterium]|jgi:hypothetical protein|nr:hypothetical protein [Verrucomicrobiota bacterium]OQC66745.1 MAG: Laminin G domain protein [Verrucomicrobia bacterium ADurb.Bin006]MDI9381596.1 hypothetical protein [Verrucomicrobiota bacterium]NMD19549.1 hypothetical protein [Verrucomicrobiota bacterium]HOA60528.1 hypothetical protein [Verrucomicrobiota bacterium]